MIAGMLFLNEPADWMRIGFISFMFFGILGLKSMEAKEPPVNQTTTRYREEL